MLSITDPTRRSLMLGMAGAALAPLAGCGGGSGSGSAGMGMGMGISDTTPAAASPLTVPIPSSGTEQSLPLIPLDEGEVDLAGVRSFALSVQTGTTSFRQGVTTRTLGYNGAMLGPALRLRKGEKTRIGVHNRLDEETTVHWHGLLVPAWMGVRTKSLRLAPSGRRTSPSTTRHRRVGSILTRTARQANKWRWDWRDC